MVEKGKEPPKPITKAPGTTIPEPRSAQPEFIRGKIEPPEKK